MCINIDCMWFGFKTKSSNGGSNVSTFLNIYFCQRVKKNGFRGLLKYLAFAFYLPVKKELLCASFCWKSIFSKDSCDSQDIIEDIPFESKQLTGYCFRRIKEVSHETFFWAMQVFKIFLKMLTLLFISFL